jgi:ADP-ribose pyrophosphatase YjhB (NUDIX family)
MSHTYEYPRPSLTADAVVLYSKPEGGWKILLIERGKEPFRGCKALPGGFVNEGETVEKAVGRELFEETGLELFENDFKLIGVFSKGGRDPRGWVVSTAFVAIFSPTLAPTTADLPVVLGTDDAASAKWYDFDQFYTFSDLEDVLDTYNLAFDHKEMVVKAFRWMIG